jgi:putative transferase (TIGR04331 family)
VCTYPNTTFSEAMASGIPTILLYIPEFFETVPEADELIRILKKANILFNDPEKAAAHVNKVWNNVEEWWREGNVEKAKKYFLESAFDINRNWLSDWKSLFKYFEKN